MDWKAVFKEIEKQEKGNSVNVKSLNVKCEKHKNNQKRLSQLQFHILKALYENNFCDETDVSFAWFLYRRGNYHFLLKYLGKKLASAEVKISDDQSITGVYDSFFPSISRSIRNLVKKGLVRATYSGGFRQPKIISVCLTEKGTDLIKKRLERDR